MIWARTIQDPKVSVSVVGGSKMRCTAVFQIEMLQYADCEHLPLLRKTIYFIQLPPILFLLLFLFLFWKIQRQQNQKFCEEKAVTCALSEKISSIFSFRLIRENKWGLVNHTLDLGGYSVLSSGYPLLSTRLSPRASGC